MRRSQPVSDLNGVKPRPLLRQSQRDRSGAIRPTREQTPQKTVSELFLKSKHKSDPEPADCVSFSPNKRQKRDLSSCESTTEAQAKLIEPENMYTFNTNGPRKTTVIDLTSSPETSPAKGPFMQRRINGDVRPTNFTPHIGAKKLVVKNFRTTSKSCPDQYYNQIWSQLDVALSAIFSGEKTPYSNEELYRGVENICRQDRAPALFQQLRDKCGKNVSTNLKPSLIRSAIKGSDTSILRAVVTAWSTWNTQLTTIRSIFYYMDRSYLLHSSSQPSLEDMGIFQFRDMIFSDPVLKPKILQGACDLLTYDRQEDSETFDNSLFQEAIGMFHVLTVYIKDFEPKLLGESQKYFADWAKRQSSASSLAQYVDACHSLMNREMSRCDHFKLESTTKRDLTTQLESSLIENKEAYLTKTQDVSDLMAAFNVRSLQKLYQLLQSKGLGARLRPPFEGYINSEGSAIVFDEERESEMVTRLLQFKKKLDTIWEFSFFKHEGLGHGLREAFESFINKTKKSNMTWGTDNPKPGEMIAKYVDMVLKGGVKAVSNKSSLVVNDVPIPNDDDQDDFEDDEDAFIGKQLDQVLDMFRFVHGKAVFEAFYKRDLARRLLMGRSASADAEKSMLTRLKTECGAGFTHNLEQMFTDIELAREEIQSYKLILEERDEKSSVDLNVNVLSASAWPTYGDVAVEIPRDIQKATADFEQYYKAKHTGRKLAWKHALAHCQLKASFPRGNKEIIVSSFQAIVMLFFNDSPGNKPASYSDIQETTNLKHEELERTLQSLACAKYRVLTKSPKGKDVSHTDTFAVNLNFFDEKYRIKINQIQLKETKEENKETHERVAADRHYETQAAIVRIMKSRKTIKHAELVAEVIKATKSRGVLDPVDIKKNIEKLIEKDYMEREEGSNSYSYLA